MLWFCVWQVVSTLSEFVRLGRRSESDKDLEILLLRPYSQKTSSKRKTRAERNGIMLMPGVGEG
jgi:hypothetical protein